MNAGKQTALPSWTQWVIQISGALGACHLTLPGDHPFPVGLLTPHPCKVYSVCHSHCNQPYSLPVVLPRWLVDLLSPEMSLYPVLVSLCSLGVFDWRLASSCWVSSSPASVFFSLHFLTYLLPTVIPSHILLLEQAHQSLHLVS